MKLPDNFIDVIKSGDVLFMPGLTTERLSMGDVVAILANHPDQYKSFNKQRNSLYLTKMEQRSICPSFARNFLQEMQDAVREAVEKTYPSLHLMVGVGSNCRSGFSYHSDDMDVIIVQLSGVINIDIGESNLPTGNLEPGSPILAQYTMNPGDAIWVPAGTAHFIHPQGERITMSFGYEPSTDGDGPKPLRSFLN